MIHQVNIWSSWLRIIHGVFILSLIALFLSGWLISQPVFAENMLVTMSHQVSSTFVGVFLVIRILLLFIGKGAENLKSFFDQGDKLMKTNELLAFYFSLGKRPLPNWHSKPALWSVLYLVMFVLIALLLFTGVMQNEQDRLLGIRLFDSHLELASWLGYLVIFHIASSVLHDVKSLNSNVSAMLNGHRNIQVEERKNAGIEVKFHK
ncbi:MAG: cytochrome b/b6 domain-containing protein [Gammaproteobacteria bacterium]|nr:cytochrome b/b6 domain-containing protein [Gammaproteobacteria bacterium]